MTPAQKFVLSCRQTREAAARLSDWLDHHPTLLGFGHDAVREDIDSLAARLPPLAAAAETVPGIGLLATPHAGKTELLFQILAARGPLTLGEFGNRPLDPSTIRGLLPLDTNGGAPTGGCAILRLTAAEMPPTPRGFPLRVGLLSVTDVAAIMAGAAFVSLPVPAAASTAAAVDALFGELSSRLSAQALPGLSERDVLDLRESLIGRWPGNNVLAALSASRYWDQFREIAAHVAEIDRRRLFGLLWNNDWAMSEVFNRLCDGLDRLGQGSDGYCAPEALLGKDKASGWMTRHPRSIIDAATLLALDQPPGPLVSMMNRYGQTVDIERAVVAGLIAELPLHLGPSRLNELAPADLLDFPVPPALGSQALVPKPPANDNLARAVTHYARTKAIYLFERATQRRDVTALVAVLNPALEDDTFAPAVGDWVESAQGANAHARERVRRSLFIAAAPSHVSRPSAAGGDDKAIQHLIHTIFGADQDWPTAWTPNRPLTGIFWFTPADGVAPSPLLGGHAASMELSAPGPAGHAQRVDSQVTALVKALSQASGPRVKLLQLNQSLQDLRRRIRHTVLRHHTSNDLAAMADWRRGTAVVVQDRLQFLIEQGRLAHLHRALMPAESDLIIKLRDARASAAHKRLRAQPSWREEPVNEANESTSFQIGHLAETALSHWFKSLRRAARSQRLCRELRIEPAILQNLVDELQIGAQRCSLANEIATAFTQSAAAQLQSARASDPQAARRLTSAERDLTRLAAYASRIIAAYVEVLGAVPGRGRQATLKTARTGSYDLEVADGPPGGYASQGARPRGGTRRTSRSSQFNWEVSFITLVEDNIASAHLLSGLGDKDRELGELIQLFASGPFEVEP